MFKKGEIVHVNLPNGNSFDAIVVLPYNGICIQVSALNWKEIGYDYYRYNVPLEYVEKKSYDFFPLFF